MLKSLVCMNFEQSLIIIFVLSIKKGNKYLYVNKAYLSFVVYFLYIHRVSVQDHAILNELQWAYYEFFIQAIFKRMRLADKGQADKYRKIISVVGIYRFGSRD